MYNLDVNQKPIVGIFTSTEGHLSLAEAAQETFDQAGYPTVFFREVDTLFPFYIFLYQLFPKMFGFFFRVTQKPPFRNKIQRFCEQRHEKKLIAFFEAQRPDLLINTYFMYIPTLEKIAQEYGVPLINILPDPHSIHPLLVSPQADLNLAFDENTVKSVNHLYPDQKINVKAIGWLVRHRFDEKYQPAEVRQKLDLQPDVLTLLLAAGSDGTSHILKILPSVLNNRRSLQVVVACGSNRALYTSVKALQKLWHRQGKPGFIVPLRFVTNLNEYIQAADLVVGKAGPNSLFETVAAYKPFFVITHVSGQEDGNLQLITDYNLGYVEENLLKASELLKSIVNQPEQLEQFQPSIAKVAEYNREAKPQLLKLAQSLLKL